MFSKNLTKVSSTPPTFLKALPKILTTLFEIHFPIKNIKSAKTKDIEYPIAISTILSGIKDLKSLVICSTF